jgi:ketosteroid isomerase-like protein
MGRLPLLAATSPAFKGLGLALREGAPISEQNAEMVRQVYRAADAGDLRAFLDVLHPDIELRTSGVYPDFRSSYRGLNDAVEYWEAARGLWDDFSIEVVRLEDLGERVVALLRQHVKGREGIVAEHTWGHVFSFSDGRVRRVVAFASWEEALEAGGLGSGTRGD